MDQNPQTAAEVSALGLDNQAAPNTSPVTSPIAVAPTGSEKKVGPIIAVLVIVLVLIISALALFASRITQPTIPDDNTAATDSSAVIDQSASGQVQPVTSNSTDVNSMQSDLDNSTTGLDNQNF